MLGLNLRVISRYESHTVHTSNGSYDDTVLLTKIDGEWYLTICHACNSNLIVRMLDLMPFIISMVNELPLPNTVLGGNQVVIATGVSKFVNVIPKLHSYAGEFLGIAVEFGINTTTLFYLIPKPALNQMLTTINDILQEVLNE